MLTRDADEKRDCPTRGRAGLERVEPVYDLVGHKADERSEDRGNDG